MGIFDTHAHYDDERFDEDRDELLTRLSRGDEINPFGVDYVMHCATDMESSLRALELAERYPFVYCALGFHPSDADKFQEGDEKKLEKLLAHPKAVAVGECGLEYHYDFVSRETQKRVLEKMFCLSERLGLPIVLHDREAHGDIMDFVYRHKDAFGIVHSYSGSGEMAKDLIRRGWYVSFSGSVTFKNAENLRAAAKEVSLDRILVETDAPYLTPVPYRKYRNDSRYCYETLAVLASVKGVTTEELCDITKRNAINLLKI